MGPVWEYITPLKSDGTSAVAASGATGFFTLEASTTYYLPLPQSQKSPGHSVHLRMSALLVITTANLQDCNAKVTEVTDYDAAADTWIPNTPEDAYVGVGGAGVSASGGVAVKTTGAVGGAFFNVTGHSARQRMAVVVGAAGGTMMCGFLRKLPA